MKLIYRGTAFDYNPSQRAVNYSSQSAHGSRAPYTLRYRGVTYHIDPGARKESSTQLKAYTLRYRGVTYFVCRHEQEKASIVSQVGNMLRFSQIEIPGTPVEQSLERRLVTQSKN